MNRRKFVSTSLGSAAILSSGELARSAESESSKSLIQSIKKVTLRRNRDGTEGTTWFHPRACIRPSDETKSQAFMCLQSIGGSDYFGPVHWSVSNLHGEEWTTPEPIPALGRIPVPDHEGLEAGVCDVVPEFHPPTNSILCMGHVVFYRGPRFSKKDQLPRYPVYTVRKADGSWTGRKILKWDDPRGSFIYTNNCGQRVTLPNGDILLAFTHGAKNEARMVTGVRCRFDGEDLTIAETGPPLTNNKGRGLLEPSITRFREKIYITIRAEDDRGYVSVSDDGIHYTPQKAWTWDDGEPLTMSTTQQHWVTHSDGLFLVYTRKDETNRNVIRWRSPLWIAQVDPENLNLIRSTEQVVLPLVGDGVNDPDKVALMGNFHTVNATPDETWVTVGEWLPKGGALGDMLMGRIRWAKPNQLV